MHWFTFVFLHTSTARLLYFPRMTMLIAYRTVHATGSEHFYVNAANSHICLFFFSILLVWVWWNVLCERHSSMGRACCIPYGCKWIRISLALVWFLVAIKISAPNGSHLQILKGISNQFADGFGNQALPPIWLANPIANLTFRCPAIFCGANLTPCCHDSYATDCFRLSPSETTAYVSGADNTPLMISRLFPNTRVRRPTCDGTDIRIAGIFVECFGIAFLPRS